MKKKIVRILGVGLTVAMIASFMVAPVPVSAGTLSITAESNIPKTEDNFLAPAGGDIVSLAGNGDTMFALVNNSTATLTDGSSANQPYKSTDGGKTWKSIHTATSYPNTMIPKLVAMAPDNPDVVIIALASSSTPTQINHIEYSSNSGGSFSNMSFPTTGYINSIDVSPARSGSYYVAAGGNDGTDAELWILRLAIAQNWATRYDTSANATPNQANINAIKFSPNWSTDENILVVSSNTTAAYFQVFRNTTNARAWNGGITYYTYADWQQGVSLGATGGLEEAQIVPDPGFLGTDEGTRVAFLSLKAITDGDGAIRMTDVVKKNFETWSGGNEGGIHSIAYHESGLILAGSHNTNNVYVCINPTATTPKFERLNTQKQPGGEGAVIVAWNGDTAVAATYGNESAFAISDDNGYSWNDVSMIDTTLTTMADAAVSADGSVVYLSTFDAANDASLWVKASDWTRVMSHQGSANPYYHVRMAPEDSDTIYVGSCMTQDFWVSKNMGKTTWKHVPCYNISTLVDFAVKDADTVFAMDADGVSKTTNAGASWGSEKKLDGTGGNMITLAPNGDILVGGDNGYANFSKDSGSTFERTASIGGGGNIQVIADKDYESNNIIYGAYAGTDTFNFKRGKADTTSSFASRGPSDDEVAITGTVTPSGLARSADGMIYAALHNGTNGEIQRALNVTTASTGALAYWSGLDRDGYLFDQGPQSLKLSEGSVKLWMIDTSGTNALASLTDISATSPPTLSAPADGFEVPFNPVYGKPYNATLSWKTGSTTKMNVFDVQISTDAEFVSIILSDTHGYDGATDIVSVVVGPTGATYTTDVDGTDYTFTGVVDFNPGDTYYWRVRMSTGSSGGFLSPWSEARSFKIAADVVFSISEPAPGAMGVSVTPSFVWAPYPDATSYEIMVAEDPTFAILDFSHNTEYTFYQATEALRYSTTYYWRVRAPGGPWIEGMFTTEAAPPEPTTPPPPATTTVIIPTPGPTQTVPVPQPAPIPSYILWVIVAIGAALVIALIILIVRTRRVV